MSTAIADKLVSLACSARKVALDRGATEFEAMRFALEAIGQAELPIDYWTKTRGQQ